MNKLKYLFGALVAVSFAACSDEPNAKGGPEEVTPVSDVAYMTINLKDVNEGRATSGTTDFEYGEGDENKIYNAKFLFFDANKNFLLEANVWNGGNANGVEPDANIEYFGQNVLVLENLKKTGYPKYLITVLNAPEKLKPIVGETTMDDVRNLCCDVYYDVDNQGQSKKFVMTTTSYKRVGSSNPYYATTLTDANFKAEPYPAANDKPVTIYVERLAVKVRLNAALTNEKKTFEIDGKEVVGYRVPVSISGNLNDEGKPAEGVTDVYVSIDGWGLSNYEPESYLSKNLDLLGESTEIGEWYWNDPTNTRSYWAASPQYGQAEPNLVRNTYVGLIGEVGHSLYMPETTNQYANVQTNKLLSAKNVASVILKTTVYDGNGKPLNLILFQGVYYLRESFVAYALQTLDFNKKLNYYTREVVASETENVQDGYHYTQIGTDDVEVVERDVEATGRIELNSKFDETTKLYAKNSEGKFELIENGVQKLNETLVGFTQGTQARASTDGSQIYNIPIEHFAKAKPSVSNVQQEGEYGTVRNHIYDVTVTSISKLGGGIFRPGEGDDDGEPIIPEDPSSTYYLSAKVNILSWKVVKQNVDL
ncbi:MAG: Mfa1 family fimbria major subunit [Muribaculum sp.]|nr:Mfa1 family fimbria major subunit [Muribaculaceae bacterium]MCM1081737.1 Mfa1 family fimbria major subunit [Muribaculum sp.]